MGSYLSIFYPEESITDRAFQISQKNRLLHQISSEHASFFIAVMIGVCGTASPALLLGRHAQEEIPDFEEIKR
jgi:hypothetical protein